MKEKEEIPYSEPDLLLESLYFTEMFSWALVTKFTILIFLEFITCHLFLLCKALNFWVHLQFLYIFACKLANSSLSSSLSVKIEPIITKQ